VNGITIPPPSSGNLATLDPGLIVTPPAGLEKGYVPIVIRQYKPLPAAEIEALEAFYRATNGAAWTNSTNWLRGTAESWHGVTIENGHVAGISLVSNNLTGTLPPEIGNLPALRFLELSLNSIGGPIPPQLGSLAALESFGMFANRLTGPIPAEIGTLTRLTRLELGSNQLTGSLPRSLGQLTALRFLLLGNNQLEGLLPSELGNLSQLTLLHLWTNRFSGPLPLSLAQLTKMQEFHFQNTGLCMPTDAGLQAWLSSISNLVSTNLSCTSGTVVITARVQSKGVDAGGPYVDIAFTNTGTGDALNTTVTSLEFKTLAGRGVVTSAASVPLALDTIAPQTSIVVRVNLSVPRTVARFSITEGVVATSAQGDALSFSLVQPVTAGTMRLELGRRNAHGND
jgi:hypothetical protein